MMTHKWRKRKRKIFIDSGPDWFSVTETPLQNFWPGQLVKTPDGIGKVIKVNRYGFIVVIQGEVSVYDINALDQYKQNLAQPKRST